MYVERIIQAQVYPRASITLVLRLYLYLYLKSRYMRYGAVGKKSVGNFTIVQFNKAPINRFPCQWDFEVNGTFFGNGKPCEQYTRRNNIWSNVIHSRCMCACEGMQPTCEKSTFFKFKFNAAEMYEAERNIESHYIWAARFTSHTNTYSLHVGFNRWLFTLSYFPLHFLSAIYLDFYSCFSPLFCWSLQLTIK